jgi:sterol 3beta-glucosyltransferase
MNVAVLALGTRGDVQPYLALTKGLLQRGHAATLVSHETFVGLAAEHGVPCAPLTGDVLAAMRSERMRGATEEPNFMLVTLRAAREARRASLVWAREGLEACRDADLLVAGIGGLFLGLALAEKLDVPLLQAHVVPFTPTRAFPAVILPAAIGRLGGGANHLSHRLLRQIMWQGNRGGDSALRRDVLGLRPLPALGPYGSERLRQHPTLYGFSRHVVPPPPDWNDGVVTGSWFVDAPADWRAPEPLTAFLDSGPPPLFIGFGSMLSSDPEATTRLVLEAIERGGVRAVVQTGWAGLSAEGAPANVAFVGGVPHDWLFARVAGAVHHGGAGTTAASFRAGVPTLIVPHFGDQGFWGERVRALGTGPAPIPRRRLTAAALAEALRRLADDGAQRARAAEVGALVRSEDGVGVAVAAIERLGRGPRRATA